MYSMNDLKEIEGIQILIFKPALTSNSAQRLAQNKKTLALSK